MLTCSKHEGVNICTLKLQESLDHRSTHIRWTRPRPRGNPVPRAAVRQVPTLPVHARATVLVRPCLPYSKKIILPLS
jgi:hypothetical protein